MWKRRREGKGEGVRIQEEEDEEEEKTKLLQDLRHGVEAPYRRRNQSEKDFKK